MKYFVVLSNPQTNFINVICETNELAEAQRVKYKFDGAFSRLGYYCDILEQTDYYEYILKALNKKK